MQSLKTVKKFCSTIYLTKKKKKVSAEQVPHKYSAVGIRPSQHNTVRKKHLCKKILLHQKDELKDASFMMAK